VYRNSDGRTPDNLAGLLMNGTKLFDALYYLHMPDDQRPESRASIEESIKGKPAIDLAKRNLLLLYIYIMLRGSYPNTDGRNINTDIPAFMMNILGMKDSPTDLSKSLCSFRIEKVLIEWVKHVRLDQLAQPIRQRIALGLPGYRMMTPFKLYECRPDVSEAVRRAYDWISKIARAPPDWSIFSATRSPQLIVKFGSLNRALGNLILKCFTNEQIDEMISDKVRILFAKPVYDPRANHWIHWADEGDLLLSDPINL